jgi:hypothetical protein
MLEAREQLTRLMAAELPDEGDLFAPPDPEQDDASSAGDDAAESAD